MKKRCFIALVLTVAVAGGAFAQTNFQTMPKNTITVDIGPTIVGAAVGIGMNMFDYDGSSGFGIAAQYERQLLEKLSVGGRLAYIGANIGGLGNEGDTYGVQFSSFSLEGHVRYYPFAKTFFMDGMMGYANMSMDFTDENNNAFGVTKNYFKYGAKIGWRIDFGKPGGFVFEPAVGYYGAAAVTETETSTDTLVVYDYLKEGFNSYFENLGVGGPRITLAFGWRF